MPVLGMGRPDRWPESRSPRWQRSPERAELLALYAEVDALVDGLDVRLLGAAKAGEPRRRGAATSR